MKINEFLKIQREKLNMSQSDLTYTLNDLGVDVSTSTVSRNERGSHDPSWSFLRGCCSIFGVTLSELEVLLNEGATEVVPKKMGLPVNGKYIPIVSWVSAGCWNDSPNIEPYEQDKIFVTGKLPVNTFALKVSGASMENCGGEFHFPDQSIILVNPDKEVKNGDFVVAFDEALNEATFKQYIDDCGTKYFKPLNPQFPVMKLTESTVIKGVVFRSINDKRI